MPTTGHLWPDLRKTYCNYKNFMVQWYHHQHPAGSLILALAPGFPPTGVALCRRRTQRKIYVPNSYDPHIGDVACTFFVEVQAHDGLNSVSLAPVAEAAWWARVMISITLA
jgi:hypothetical protein